MEDSEARSQEHLAPPAGAALSDAETGELLTAWWNFTQAMKRHVTPSLQREHNLEFKDFVTLSAIEEGAHYPGQICTRFSMTPSAVSRLVDELVGGGLIERRIDQHDSRRVRLSLTAAGDAVLGRARHTMQQVLRQSLGTLEAGQVQVFAEVLLHLTRSLAQPGPAQPGAQPGAQASAPAIAPAPSQEV